MKTPLILKEDQVRERLRTPDLIEAMQRALITFSAGKVEQPVRTVFRFGEGSLFASMPCYVPSLPALGAKLVTICPETASRGLGTHQATIVMLDPVTGVVDAMVDGRYITEVRTAAVSAVSARLLAREDAKVLGVLGSGVQARSHVEALRLVRDFREVRGARIPITAIDSRLKTARSRWRALRRPCEAPAWCWRSRHPLRRWSETNGSARGRTLSLSDRAYPRTGNSIRHWW